MQPVRLQPAHPARQQQQRKQAERQADPPRQRLHDPAGLAAVPHQEQQGRKQARHDREQRHDHHRFHHKSLVAPMRRLRPPLLIGCAALALVAALLALGFWQLDRADARRAHDARQQARAQLAPVYLTRFPEDGTLAELAGRQVRLRGRYLPRQFLRDNQVLDRRPGYHVLTPFELATYQQVVLVDRGWVPAGADRRRLPAAPLPDAPDAPRALLEGRMHLPQPNPFTDAAHLLEGESWPQVIQDIDYERLAERLGELALVPAVVRLGPQEPHGFERRWPPPPMSAAKHTGYAVQWFAMAGMALLLFALYYRRYARPPR